MDTMKLQTDTRRRKGKGNSEIFIRARATPELKERLESYAKTIDRTPAWVMRNALVSLLDSVAATDKKAA